MSPDDKPPSALLSLGELALAYLPLLALVSAAVAFLMIVSGLSDLFLEPILHLFRANSAP